MNAHTHTARLGSARRALAVALVPAALAVAAPAAGATPPLPPLDGAGFPGVGDSSRPPSEGSGGGGGGSSVKPSPRPQHVTKMLSARAGKGRLTFKVTCESSGRMRLSTAGSVRRQLGTRRFACAGGRATASFRVSRATIRRTASARGVDVVLDVASSDNRARLPIALRRAVNRVTARSAANLYWRGFPAASCAAGKVFVSTLTDRGFGAYAGETVYWRPWLQVHEGNGWRWIPHNWQSYRVTDARGGGGFVPGTDYWVMGGVGIPTTLTQSFNVGRGTWTRSAVQVWTPRGGYDWNWITSSADYGVDGYNLDYCYFR